MYHLMIKYTRWNNATVQEDKVDELIWEEGRYFPGIYCVLLQILMIYWDFE